MAKIQCRIGERLSGQGICQICARMQHLGKKWFSLDRSSGCGIPLKRGQECGIRAVISWCREIPQSKKMFLTLANTSVKCYVFIKAPFEGNIFESSLSDISHPQISNTQTIRPPHCTCLLTLKSSLSIPPFPTAPQSS